MTSSPAKIRKQMRLYWIIGIALCTFTVTTLLLGMLDFGPPGLDFIDVGLGLLVAVTKASLVALIFMHLSNERGFVYKLLIFTTDIAIGLAVLTALSQHDTIPPNVHMVQKVGYPHAEYAYPGRPNESYGKPTRGGMQ